MLRQRYARITIIGAVALAAVLGCAVSEPVEPDQVGHNVNPTGLGGSAIGGAAGPGSGGSGDGAGTTGVSGASGASGSTGISGAGGSAGMKGSAGAGSSITSGQAGTGDGADAGATGGSGGNAGQTGSGGSGASGNAGRGGASGSGGRGGAGGSGGRGGTGGSGGAGGSGGRGGSTGSAGTSGTTDAGTGADAAATVTFTDIYTNILVPYCSGSSCHSPGSQGGVSFASQSTAYTAVRNRVTPGNGTGSRFYTTVNSGSMPRGAAKLSAANLAKIKAWIDQGALNN